MMIFACKYDTVKQKPNKFQASAHHRHKGTKHIRYKTTIQISSNGVYSLLLTTFIRVFMDISATNSFTLFSDSI